METTVHGPPVQARVVAANRAVLATCTTILAHMAMNKGRGNAKQNGGKRRIEGSRHGWQRWAGKAWQNKAVAGEHSRQMKWPAQALKQKHQQTNPTGTGLAVNSRQTIRPAQALK